MENQPDHEYQRTSLLRAIRHAHIEASELWLHYFGLGGDAGEYEVEAYLHGSFTLPPLQRDLLAHAANELIDKLPPLPRAPYSTDPPGTKEPEEPGRQEQEQVPAGDGALDWLYRPGPAGETGSAPGGERRGEPDGSDGRIGPDVDGSGPPRPNGL